MATGPDHYRTAEDLLVQADELAAEYGGEAGQMLIAAAQVHATLALAAATALVDDKPRSDSFATYRDWQKAAG